MNNLKYNLLTICLLLSFCLGAQSRKTYQKTFKVDKNTRLLFSTDNIDVTFKLWNRDEVKVDFEVNFKNYSEKEIKEISDQILISASLESSLGDANHLQIRNHSASSIARLSYRIDGEIYFKNFLKDSKKNKGHKTLAEINKEISKQNDSFQELEGYIIFKNDSVALKNVERSNHKGIQSISSKYEIYIPKYLMMDVNASRATVNFDGKFTNKISGGFQESTLKAKELSNEGNAVSFINGSVMINKITSGMYAFRNVTKGMIGQLDETKLNMEFSKFTIGEISKNTEIKDFKSDISIYNLAKEFGTIQMFCEYSDIKLFLKKDHEYYMEAIGHNAIMNEGDLKIGLQPNREGKKYKMFSRGDKYKNTTSNTFKLDLVHGFITLDYIK